MYLIICFIRSTKSYYPWAFLCDVLHRQCRFLCNNELFQSLIIDLIMLILLVRPSQVSSGAGVNLRPLYDLQRLTSVLVHTNLNFTLQIRPRPPAYTTDVAFTTIWCTRALEYLGVSQ